MATLKAIDRAIRDNSTIEVAKENIEIEKEQKKSQEEVKRYMKRLGIGNL